MTGSEIAFIGDSEVDQWKESRVRRKVEYTAEELIDEWNLMAEVVVEDPIEVHISHEFGACVDSNSITLSDPDLYRVGMKHRFDDEDVAELVDKNYPVQFHEVAEEVGQLIGRRANRNWERLEDIEDGIKDEMYGLMSINFFYPEFGELYSSKFEENLEAVKQINSEEQIELVYNDGEELDSEDLIDLVNRDYGSEVSYSRGKAGLPTPYAVDTARFLVENNLDPDDIDPEKLEARRDKKLYNDALPWIARITADNLRQELTDSYSKDDIIENDLPSDTDSEGHPDLEQEMRKVEQQYGLDNPYI